MVEDDEADGHKDNDKEGDKERDKNKNVMQQLYEATMTVPQVLKENRCDMIARVIRKKVKVQKKNDRDFTILVFHILDKEGTTMKCEAIGKEALASEKKIQIGNIYKF